MVNQAVGRWSRRFAAASAWFFAGVPLAHLADAGRRPFVILALFGAVFHMVFGKAYLLVPSYFERVLAVERAPAVHFGLSTSGTLALAAAAVTDAPGLAAVGAGAWTVGVGLFLGSLAWTLRDNPTGSATGTGSARANDRLDRVANAFVPVSLAYLAVGSYAVLARATGLPTPLDGYPPRAAHLLAAGSAGLLLFALGSRLVPRFLGGDAPTAFAVSLPVGAVGPALIAVSLGAGDLFRLGAGLEAAALVAFAAGYVQLFRRSKRVRIEGRPPARRVGEYAILAGVVAGALAAAVGLSFAFGGYSADLLAVHRRLTLVGFLGLSIVGFAYQFYPPRMGSFRGASDRGAMVTIALLAGGLATECAGLLADLPAVRTAGVLAFFVGALGYAYVLTRVLIEK